MSELERNTFNTSNLVKELSSLIEDSKYQVANVANSTLTLLFWQIGNLFNKKY